MVVGGTCEVTMKLQIREILSRPVSELLKARQVIKCTPETSIAEAVKLIREKKVGSIVIAYGLRVLGIFTEKDFLEKLRFKKAIHLRLPSILT